MLSLSSCHFVAIFFSSLLFWELCFVYRLICTVCCGRAHEKRFFYLSFSHVSILFLHISVSIWAGAFFVPQYLLLECTNIFQLQHRCRCVKKCWDFVCLIYILLNIIVYYGLDSENIVPLCVCRNVQATYF